MTSERIYACDVCGAKLYDDPDNDEVNRSQTFLFCETCINNGDQMRWWMEWMRTDPDVKLTLRDRLFYLGFRWRSRRWRHDR